MTSPAEITHLPQRQLTEAESNFALAVRKARALSNSTLVPKEYQGEAGLANVMIAMEVAQRIGANELMVMQNLFVVHGRPSWSSTFLIATVNACGRFSPLRFQTDGGDDASAKTFRCRAYAKDRESGEVCNGAWITWKMIDAEGWAKKAGSKWLTMPEQMFQYRAAAFWTRVYAPELSLGIHTADEMQDTFSAPISEPRSSDIAQLQDTLRQRATTAIEHEQPPADMNPATGEVPPPAKAIDAKKLNGKIFSSETLEELEAHAADIALLPDGAEKDEVNDMFLKRQAEIKGGK